MNVKTILSLSILSLVSQVSYADTVTVKATKEVLENVKTSSPTANYVLVESKDGTKQAFKKNAVDVVTLPVVWDPPKEETKPGFFGSIFASQETKEETKTEVAKSEEPKENPENQGFFARRLPELAIGGMALLWLILP
ncbi:LIMLP_04285 family protein [Leptospira terpstrae]|uniref:LIMLP_04285 family protein n=1 Tax=Leptospira terpstrae TaxID=293075 RepID=UPI003D01F93F